MIDFNHTLLEIHKLIKWLQVNAGTNDVNTLSIQLNYLAVHSFYFAEAVSDADAEASNSENDYKTKVAEWVSTQPGVTKAEREAETKFAKERKDSIESRNLQRKLKLKLDRIDKICDHYKQRVSVIKTIDVKGL